MLPTYAVIACLPFAAAAKIGSLQLRDAAARIPGDPAVRAAATGGQAERGRRGRRHPGQGRGQERDRHAQGDGHRPGHRRRSSPRRITTAVIRGEGGFGGQPGQRPVAPEIPDREPDAQIALPTREDQALIYRLSGDRNPLHSDPWFARELAGFPKPILHGLCTYGVAGRALVGELGGGDATKVTADRARFTSPVFPGETLTTSIWRTEPGHAVFRTEAANPDGSNARLVLEDGVVEYTD